MRLTGLVLLCCLLAQPCWSGEAPPREPSFDIESQPLAAALVQFSVQSGIQMVAPDDWLEGHVARAVRGRMPATRALDRLLSATGLGWRQVNAGTIALIRAPAPANSPTGPPGAVRGGTDTAPGSAAPAMEEEPAELEEVVVTGTRIQVPGNYTAASPMVSISGEEIRRLGFVNVADALTMLVPQNIPSWQPALTGDEQDGTIVRGSFFIGNTIANLRGLDPTFGTRTLTLIDGRRVVSTSNQADVVDLNIIPSTLLRRVDVATGGASSTYGSGAMAGVVNLVLDHRLSGVNVELDYGVNETGDGGSPHLSVSGGTPLLGGRAHALLGVEWQDSKAIRDCAAARDWCSLSRTMYHNFSGSAEDASAVLAPLPGLAGYPSRFQMNEVRYSQFAPTGTIYSSSAANTAGFRFTADGTGVEEYAYGFRGGTGRQTVGGDGPLTTTGLAMRPQTERRTAFADLEYRFAANTTGYLQGSYALTDSLNRNRFTVGNACVRFNSMGTPAVPGGAAAAGEFIPYGGNGEAFTDPFTGAPVADIARHPLWANPNFRAVLGNAPSGRVPPYFVPPGNNGSTDTTPPLWTFTNGINPVWQRIRSARGTDYWNLVGVTLTVDFDDPGTPALLPTLGRNSYHFLRQLSPEALYQVQRAFDNSITAGGGPGLDNLYGPWPCDGHTAVRKVWNPQVQQWTEQHSRTMRGVAGMRGRLGQDWRWEAYYQYGRTQSTSKAMNVQTNLSFAFAMDAVIDDRQFIDGVANPGFGQPVCRITRDGVPMLDYQGRPLSDPAGLAAVAQGCQPLNILGTTFATPEAQQLQREALAYAFKDNISDGANSLQTLAFTSSGTLWRGWAGPLRGAFGLEVREDRVDNKGSRGPFYLRADMARSWGDAFGGRTRVYEGYTELDLPLVSGAPAVNLLSLNAGLRYAAYNNKGGAGTTGESATQDTLNWKLAAVLEPFDWVRLRLTRSRDLRAAGYRDLFLNQPGVPDSVGGQGARNPWRERTADSQENQYERWGTVAVGNADLRPEKSDTLTLGIVLSPGRWARGMRLSADYYSIRVRDGIYTPYGYANPIITCWERSGNVEPRYVEGQDEPEDPGVNGRYDATLPECREITFSISNDASRNLQDIISYNASRPVNGLPYRRRGVDLSWNYVVPLNAVVERLPGTASLTVRGTRALESSGVQQLCPSFGSIDGEPVCNESLQRVDLVGQIRSSVFIPGVSPSPKWTGHFTGAYSLGRLVTSLSARYVGGAKLDNTWSDSPAGATYQDAAGDFLYGSVDRNRVPPYLNFSLNGSYDLAVPTLRQFQVFGSVNNLFDKSPPFTGGSISGASAQYHDIMGRAYRLGVRLRF